MRQNPEGESTIGRISYRKGLDTSLSVNSYNSEIENL